MFFSSVLVPSSVAAGRAHRDVGVDPQAALLHVHVGDAELAHRLAQQPRPLGRFGGAAQVGLGDDLDQRRAAAVEVDQRGVGAVDPARLADVDRLRRVLLEVGAVDADVAEPAVAGKRDVVLADLVGLRVVGIEVVLAVEDRARRDLALQRRGDLQRVEDRLLVGHRQHARVGEADRAGVDVRLVAEGELAAAEHLRPRRQLDVDLEPDHRLQLSHQAPPSGALRVEADRAARARRRPRAASARRRPGAAIWKPTGSSRPAALGRGQPGRDRDRRDPGQAHRHREEVVEVHRQRVVGLLAEPEGDRGRGRGDDEVDRRRRRRRSPRRSACGPSAPGRSRRRSSRRRARRCRA